MSDSKNQFSLQPPTPTSYFDSIFSLAMAYMLLITWESDIFLAAGYGACKVRYGISQHYHTHSLHTAERASFYFLIAATSSGHFNISVRFLKTLLFILVDWFLCHVKTDFIHCSLLKLFLGKSFLNVFF